jgi:hypothetical protein
MNAMLAVARFNAPGGFRALIADGPDAATLTGPILDDAAYPDVLVAAARTDGADLRMVLCPGAGPARVPIGIKRLVPGRRYRVHGAGDELVTADDRGDATVAVDLTGRTEVALLPVP